MKGYGNMSELKSSFMGGYSKKSVDTYIVELQNENETLKKQLEVAEQSALKADKLLNENTLLNNEIEKLNQTIIDLEEKLTVSEESNNDYISNIGQIFYSAYESGAKITENAEIGSKEFLDKISNNTLLAKQQIKKSIESYSAVNNEIKNLLSNLMDKISNVSQDTDNLINKATMIAQEMDSIEAVQIANESKARQAKEEYKEFFDSFNLENQGKTSFHKPVYPIINKPINDKIISKKSDNDDETQSIIDMVLTKNSENKNQESKLSIEKRLEQIKNPDKEQTKSNNIDTKDVNEKAQQTVVLREVLKQYAQDNE